jgi:hypothetical protein
MLEQT